VTQRRRRAILLLALALAAGGISASRVSGREARVDAELAPLVPALVARADIAPGDRIKAADLAIRQVPQRFAPADALSAPEQAVGRAAAAPVIAGGYITSAAFAGGSTQDGEPSPLTRGQRAIEIPVAGGQALDDAEPGTHVDVLVTTESRSGSGRTFLALQDVELLGVRDASDGSRTQDGAAAHATSLATLRVGLRQAVYLTAAQSFAREVRLLVRAPGDRRGVPAIAVSGAGL
jgi:pilus assembly protein CpaB